MLSTLHLLLAQLHRIVTFHVKVRSGLPTEKQEQPAMCRADGDDSRQEQSFRLPAGDTLVRAAVRFSTAPKKSGRREERVGF